jgi:ribonuclease R
MRTKTKTNGKKPQRGITNMPRSETRNTVKPQPQGLPEVKSELDINQRIIELIDSRRVPLFEDDIELELGCTPEELRDNLSAMVQDGTLMQTKRKGYGLPRQLGCVAGVLKGTASGAAFIATEGGEDFFVPTDGRSGSMHNDRVLARVIKSAQGDRRGEAEVLSILTRANDKIVGVYRKTARGGIVTSDERKLGGIFIPEGSERGAWDGSKVVVDITHYPDHRRDLEGKVTEVLGDQGETEAEILSIIRSLGIRDVFPPQVKAEADHVAAGITPEDLAGRLDLRNELIVTVDGADAKDLDDAVSLTKLEGGHWKLGVHIADVSNYVKAGGVIDAEAWKRGTSVYLLNTVIPMLPERLSNGACSLHPGEDRLTLSCIMELDGAGALVGCEVAESVIRSKARLTYDEVNAIIEQNDAETMAKRANLVDTLRLMDELRETLRKRRLARGAIDLNIDEPHIELDENGAPVAVSTRYRGNAHKLIEEFMLCANETVAAWLEEMGMPVIFRVHEVPDGEKMGELAVFLKNLGYSNKGLRRETHPMALQVVLNEVKGTAHESVIARIMLRSMKKAKYSTNNVGHFGLAAKHYCHFTSPIRRYPDLMVHRMIRSALQGISAATFAGTAEKAAVQSSETERTAMEAERAVDSLKMTEYMADKVGEEYEGVISGVTEFGIFVELPNLIEGLIRMNELQDDYYDLDKKTYSLVGRHRGRRLSLGDKLRIRVAKVDVAARQIDFVPARDVN